MDQNQSNPYQQAGQPNPYQQPGANPYQQTPPKPDSYMVWAILSTLLCCLPFGIVAIVMASKVDGYWYAGRYNEAQKAASDAKKWSIASAVSAIVVYILYFILMIAII